MVITAFYGHLLLRLYLVTVVVNLGGLLVRIKEKISRRACLYLVFLIRSSAVKRSMLPRYCLFQRHRGDRKYKGDTSVAPCLSFHPLPSRHADQLRSSAAVLLLSFPLDIRIQAVQPSEAD